MIKAVKYNIQNIRTENKIIESWIEKDIIKVTLVCITFNQEKYIEDTIIGFLRQETNFRIEILIYDDVSTDSTSSIIEKYVTAYPRLITHILPNENQYSKNKHFPWQSTFEIANGEYIAICEGDDYWTAQDKTSRQVYFLDRNKSYVLSYSKALINFVGQEDNSISTVGNFFKKDQFYFKNHMATLTVMFRRKCLNGYFREVKEIQKQWLQSDYPLWLWLSSKGDIHFEDRVTAVYRVLNSSASRPSSLNQQYQFKLSYLNIVEYFSSKNIKKDVKNMALSKSNFNIGIWCIKRSLKDAFFHMDKSIHFAKGINKFFLIIFFNYFMVKLYLIILSS